MREEFAAVRLPAGYITRALRWIGRARVESIFDTGSTRNSVDDGYLHALLTNEQTGVCVRDVIDIEPISCTSMQEGSSFRVT